ncbi:MAG: hypothetical protein GXY14_04010 [Spirochaetes bacterium]|nr:hypothetical protein [Spirochaetota bacterium]
MKKLTFLLPLFLIIPLCFSCQTTGGKDSWDSIKKENDEFLRAEDRGTETFRVLLSSDGYKVVQLKNEKTIERAPDDGGDKFMIAEMEKYDMIDEVRIGVVSVWLFPDSGAINKIRSQRPTNFTEIDSLINDDIMRWNFRFPKKVVEPTKFEIIYRVVLRKKLSDEQILNSVQEKMKEDQ